MAGESPGREQQHETSGEPAGRPVVDPRLAVFRAPTETRVAGVAESARADHAGASVDSAPAHAPETADEALSGARPHPISSPATPSATNTPNDVSPLDGAPDSDTSSGVPASPPAPREPVVTAPKAEPNRDQGDGAEEAAGSGGADEVRDAPAADPAARVAEGAVEEAEDAPGDTPEGGGPAPERTPVEQNGARTAGGQEGGIPPAGEPGGEAAAERDDVSGVPDDVAEGGPAEEPADSPAEESADGPAEEPADVPMDVRSDAPVDVPPGGASDVPADVPPEAVPGAPAQPASADSFAPPRAPERIVKPLVSDLPEWPRGATDGRGAGPRAQVAFGAPGRPVEARTGPGAPVRPGAVPLPPAATPERDGAAAPGEVLGPEGTRGMAVPPSPDQPLKLLAELTNTPPPPQTVIRTIVRRFKIWTPFVLLLAIVFVAVQALRPLPSPELKLTAPATYTFSGTPLPQSLPWPGQGQSVAEVEGLGPLGVRGAQTPVPIASVTKVMTAYLILRDHPLSGKQTGPMITVDAQAANEAASTDESTAHVRKGQQFTERQMLQLLLIPSGNNIARLLARWDSGTQEAFVAKMKTAAAGLGMTQTTYTGASGFEETTVSTAVDQLKLAREVMKNEVFRSVVAMPNIDIPGVGLIYNNNQDLVKAGVVGIKTGSSTPAGGALMWAAHKTVNGKQQLILGVMLQQRGGSSPFDMLTVALKNSQKLIEGVQGGLTAATIVKKGEVVGEVEDGLGGTTQVVAEKDLTAIGWPGMKTDVALNAFTSGVPHNAKAGSRIGTVSFGTGSARTSVPVVLKTDLNEPSFGTKLVRVS